MSLGRNAILTLTLMAAAAISRRTFVTAAGSTAGAGAHAIGVSTEDALEGDSFAVDTDGVTEVVAEAAIAADALVEVGAAGGAVTKDTGIAVARTIEAASAAGVVVRVKMIPN